MGCGSSSKVGGGIISISGSSGEGDTGVASAGTALVNDLACAADVDAGRALCRFGFEAPGAGPFSRRFVGAALALGGTGVGNGPGARFAGGAALVLGGPGVNNGLVVCTCGCGTPAAMVCLRASAFWRYTSCLCRDSDSFFLRVLCAEAGEMKD